MNRFSEETTSPRVTKDERYLYTTPTSVFVSLFSQMTTPAVPMAALSPMVLTRSACTQTAITLQYVCVLAGAGLGWAWGGGFKLRTNVLIRLV